MRVGRGSELPETVVPEPDIPVASTVVLVRDAPVGPEVLMMERPNRGSFAGAWVFPGGKLDPEDAEGMQAAVTELAVAARAGVREVWEETRLTVSESALVAHSCWTPPSALAHRIRTWFFVAADPGGELTLSPHEAVAARWIRPAEALALHGEGEFLLFPPTWVTLFALARHESAADMLDASRGVAPEHFVSRLLEGSGTATMIWNGDAAYPSDRADERSRGQHRLEMARLPWRYVREASRP